MAKVTFIEPSGTAKTIDVPNGWSLMRGAVSNSVEGILADCGGACACATCHVMVEDPGAWPLKPPDDAENNMLDFTAADRQPGSRLSCQIVATAALDGLVVRVAPEQA